jgi:hypothetical protein
MVKYTTNTADYVIQLLEWIKTLNVPEPNKDNLIIIEKLINDIVLDLNTRYENGTDYFDNSNLQDFVNMLSSTSTKVIKLLFPNLLTLPREEQETIVKTLTKSIARGIIKDDLYELDIFM